jgi:hypothetical protein
MNKIELNWSHQAENFNVGTFLYMFFWVFPRRQIEFCRRFGTLCQVHLQRLDVEFILNLMPGKYPKEHTQDSEYGKNLKSRIGTFSSHNMFLR